MLTIMRKYTIGVYERDASDIKSKIEEFNVSIQRIDHHGMNIKGREIIKIYFDCMSNEEEMDKLIEYLQLSFKGFASIIF